MRSVCSWIFVFCCLVNASFSQSNSQPPASQPPANNNSKQNAEPPKLSAQFKEAGFTASEAISDMPDVKLPDDGYQQKKAVAQKAVEAASQKAGNEADQDALKILQAWLALAIKQYDSSARHDMKAFQQAADANLYCTAEAKMVFKPQVLSERGKAMAAEKKCLSEYQKLQSAK